MVRGNAVVANDNDFAEMREILAGYCVQFRQKAGTDDCDLSMRVVQNVFVIMRLGLRVDRYRDGADFDRAEEAIKKFRRIEKQEEYALTRMHAEIAKRVSSTVGAFEELLVGDALFVAFDGDFIPAAFVDVAIHEVGGDVEQLR